MSTSQKPAPRRLTVTYYVEPQTLRTITIPVQRANVLIFGLSGAVLWTLASGLFLGARLVSGGHEAPPAVAALNEAVQVAPPAPAVIVLRIEDKPAPVLEAKVESRQVEPKPVEVEPKPVEVEPVEVKAVEAPAIAAADFGPPAVLADPQASVPPPAPTPLAARLAVIDPAFAYKTDEGVFNLDFKIQNKGKPEAKGKVWGVASFAAASGKHLEIASADGVSFRAKSLTLKALQFPLPDSEPGYIDEVTIHVSEDAAAEEMISTYKLDETGAAIR